VSPPIPIHRVLFNFVSRFQWVTCQLDMLRRCTSINTIRKAMSALPKSLDETYDRLLLGIDEIHQTEVMKVLHALTVSVRQLTLEEVVEILATDLEPTPPRFEPDSRLLDPRTILSMCSSLVTTSRAEQWGAFGAQALRLAHASVADYLTRPNPSGPSQFHFTRNSARQFLAQTCLAYLLNPDFSGGDNGFANAQVGQRLKAFPFLRHAVSFWPAYLKREAGDPKEHLTSRTKEILQMFFSTRELPNGGNFAAWVRMLIPRSPTGYVQNTHPLYYAASFGLFEVVRIILDTEKGLDINALGGRARATALHVAAYRDHINVARLLLERGAEPNIPNDINESPMYWAQANGNREMQALLEQYGASNSRDPIWGRYLRNRERVPDARSVSGLEWIEY
jgi:ankyrin repeat domain-containing protein 50